jgi:hypothetical protein
MKKHNELNLKFNGNMALASNSFSKALAKFDKETRGNDMNICTRNDFNLTESNTFTCKHEQYCDFEGTCPMQTLADEWIEKTLPERDMY